MMACSPPAARKSRGTQPLCSFTIPYRSRQSENLLAVMSSHSMNRPAPIPVLRPAPDEIHARVQCVMGPRRWLQALPLGSHARLSVRPEHRLRSGSSSPGSRSAPGRQSGWMVSAARRLPRRSRRTFSASGRRPAANPVRLRASKWALSPKKCRLRMA